ncbi:MAG: NfeD family protein [Tyzzerella sp.]|nr:NfeD family protein [Tyzzerella sp.]
METIFWLILFVVLLIIEIFTMGLTTVWFAGGALVAFVLAFVGLGLPVQIIVFLLVSILLLVLTRPIAIKFFNQERQKTNADSLIGQRAVVLETIDTLHGTGRVEVNGMEWSAKAEDAAAVIEAGAVVSVEGIQGVKLIVKKEEA